MDINLAKILSNLIIIFFQVFIIFEIERLWNILKGNNSTTALKILQYIELPFFSFIKDKKMLRLISILVYPLIMGFFCAGGIPFLNYFSGTDIKLGSPWGYIAMFGAGYLGMNILILTAYIQRQITVKKVSLDTLSYLIMFYIVVLLISVYAQVKIFLIR
ncbi:hypothetical protein [Chryseobacterium sp. FH1]|uniref:hypothetical protein n=1 Tax=Chryseobacterium sp. FH1 TaxID=1233951 RepID=UPI0004E46A0C|nr:hypothetical protein [Chryseobacterium sp. FH1]KFC19558.1 hypothetical protein IO90_09755 [Chryseobacterium sp. FH1]